MDIKAASIQIEYELVMPSIKESGLDDDYCYQMMQRIMKDAEDRILGNSEPEKEEK